LKEMIEQHEKVLDLMNEELMFDMMVYVLKYKNEEIIIYFR